MMSFAIAMFTLAALLKIVEMMMRTLAFWLSPRDTPERFDEMENL